MSNSSVMQHATISLPQAADLVSKGHKLDLVLDGSDSEKFRYGLRVFLNDQWCIVVAQSQTGLREIEPVRMSLAELLPWLAVNGTGIDEINVELIPRKDA